MGGDYEPNEDEGLSEEERALVAKIRTEPEVLRALVPQPPGEIDGIRAFTDKWLAIAKHTVAREVKAPGIVGRLFNVGSFLWLPLGAIYTLGFTTYSSIGVLLLLILGTRKVWKLGTAPANKELQEHRFSERKLALMDLIGRLAEWRKRLPSESELRRFRRETLEVVAGFVREYRADHQGTSIFANLLVPLDGGERFCVVARDQEHRNPNVVYEAKVVGAVAKAFRAGDCVIVDDLQKEYPDTQPGKSYRSILAVPLSNGSEILAILSIDSSELYHFTTCSNELITGISPYRALLVESLVVESA